jgi:CubicO group peptidase (beta-lactamase class C family)
MKSMPAGFAALLALSAAFAAAPATAPAPPALQQAIATLQRDIPLLMAGEQIPGTKRVPGLSIAVVDDGIVAWQSGFGVTAHGSSASVTADTIFEAASLSKPVTAHVALQMADAGLLDLETPLTRYVAYPDLPDDARARAITARHVLSHTTGFPNWRGADPLRVYFTPGDRFSYSGEGYVYLQRAIEAIAKEPFDTTARRLVFTPLGMSRSSFVTPTGENRAAAHTDAGTPLRRRPDTAEANAAASLRTTATDYARFLSAALRGARLKPETAARMTAPQVQLDPACMRCTERIATVRSEAVAWGLGWGLEHGSEGRGIWHWGDNPGFKSYVAASLGARRGVVFFTNSDAGLSLRNRLVEIALGGTHPAHEQIRYAQVAR